MLKESESREHGGLRAQNPATEPKGESSTPLEHVPLFVAPASFGTDCKDDATHRAVCVRSRVVERAPTRCPIVEVDAEVRFGDALIFQNGSELDGLAHFREARASALTGSAQGLLRPCMGLLMIQAIAWHRAL